MNFKEKIWKALGITEAEYNKALEKHEREKMGCVSEYIDQKGKSMATNWGAAQQAVDLQQLKLAQQAAMLNNTAAQQQAAMASAWNQASIGGYATQQAQPINFRQTIGSTPKGLTPTFEQLEDPDSPFNLSLEALSVMWGARFGYRWVKDEDTADAVEENEEMWSIVSSRLLEAGLLVNQNYRHLDKIGMGTAWKLIEKDHGNS